MIVHDPGGNGFRITEMWAFIAVHDDGDESVVAAPIGDTVMPLVAADRVRVDQLRRVAMRIGKIVGKEIKLVHFSEVTVEEVFEP
jgi:hypothetical protein